MKRVVAGVLVAAALEGGYAFADPVGNLENIRSLDHAHWGSQVPGYAGPSAAAPSPGQAAPAPAPPRLTAAEACVAAMPLRQRVGQLIMAGIYANALTADTPLFAQNGIGGAVLMSSPANPKDGSIQRFAHGGKIPVLIATDQEGGQVMRFNFGPLPSSTEVAATETPAQAEAGMYRQAVQLRAAGINMVLGPLADVGPQGGQQGPMLDRVFSNDPNVVATYDAAYLQAMAKAGVTGVLKHFPGNGSASGNTDMGPAYTPPLNWLESHDFVPYRKLLSANGPAVMVGNQSIPGVTNGQPSSESRAVITGLLRGQLGDKNGVVITDALTAQAIKDPLPVAVEKSIEAGADMALFVLPANQGEKAQSNLLASIASQLVTAVEVGRLSEAQLNSSVERILALKRVNPCAV